MKEGASSKTSASCWWEMHRFRYNMGLVVAGILAFIAYAVVGCSLLPTDAGFEITLFTTLFQGVGYLVMIGIANIFYFLGPLCERFVRPADREHYRHTCYRLGFWFSISLPFSIPIGLVILAIFHPEILENPA